MVSKHFFVRRKDTSGVFALFFFFFSHNFAKSHHRRHVHYGTIRVCREGGAGLLLSFAIGLFPKKRIVLLLSYVGIYERERAAPVRLLLRVRLLTPPPQLRLRQLRRRHHQLLLLLLLLLLRRRPTLGRQPAPLHPGTHLPAAPAQSPLLPTLRAPDPPVRTETSPARASSARADPHDSVSACTLFLQYFVLKKK